MPTPKHEHRYIDWGTAVGTAAMTIGAGWRTGSAAAVANAAGAPGAAVVAAAGLAAGSARLVSGVTGGALAPEDVPGTTTGAGLSCASAEVSRTAAPISKAAKVASAMEITIRGQRRFNT